MTRVPDTCAAFIIIIKLVMRRAQGKSFIYKITTSNRR